MRADLMASSSGNNPELGEHVRHGQRLHLDQRQSLLTAFRVLRYNYLALPSRVHPKERTHHSDKAQIPFFFQVFLDALCISPRRLTNCFDE